MEQIKCSETSEFNNQTPEKYPKDNTQYSKHGESLFGRFSGILTQSGQTKINDELTA